jgi:predicted O-methyltransferase YrrM
MTAAATAVAGRPQLTVRQTDALASKVLAHCRSAGLVDTVPTDDDWATFHAFRQRLYDTFEVPDTTLTPLSARVLYGLALARRPLRVATLGCYAGNLYAWVSGPGFGPERVYDGELALGIDVDTDAVELARRNVARAGFTRAEPVVGDAFDPSLATRGPWDMVLVDIDVPGSRKSGYPRVVELWAPHLAPGALVVAHDVCHPAFRWDLRCYHDFILEAGAETSTTLPIDDCGLEVSRWRAP